MKDPAPKLFCKQTQEYVAQEVELATTFWKRGVGLLGRRTFPHSSVLWLEPTSSIHTFFMAWPIDVVFLDRNYKIQKIVPSLAPWRICSCRKAYITLEWRAGALQKLKRPLEVGMDLELRKL